MVYRLEATPDLRERILEGRRRVHDGHSGGWGEAEGGRRDGDILLLIGEGETGFRAVGLLDFDGGDHAFGGYGEGETLDAFFLVRAECQRG